MIEHDITHYYQPTNHTCSQSALAMLLSFFGQKVTPQEIAGVIPVIKNDKGEDCGTINQQLATWCLSHGFEVEMHTADFQIIDLSWADLPKEELLKRMEVAKEHREIPALTTLDKSLSKIYTQSYIDFVSAGGVLHIRPFMTTELLDSLLQKSPLLSCVCMSVFYNIGRFKLAGLRECELDDISGKLYNHTIIIYGKNDKGNYLIADPWKKPGLYDIEPKRLLAAITAAQMECDNLLFQLSERNS